MTSPQTEDRDVETCALVAATDLSPGAVPAAERAARIARRLGAPLCLFHAVNSSPWASLAGSRGPAPDVQGRLSAMAADLGRQYGIPAMAATAEGSAAAAIAGFAGARGARLLAVGEHGEDWVRSLMLGGTALKVLARAAVPVLLVRRPAAAEYARVLVATDFSDADARAARLARELFPDARCDLVHAYSVLFEGRMRLAGSSNEEIERFREDERLEASRRMGAFTQAVGWRQEGGDSVRLVPGPPALVIQEEAATFGADLIVVGKHRGSPVGERLLGSVTQNILYYAGCDVLVVP